MSATVDADLLAAAQQAVAEGRVGSVSAWVNQALLNHRAGDDGRGPAGS